MVECVIRSKWRTQRETEKSYQQCKVGKPLKRVKRGKGLGGRNWGRRGRKKIKRTGYNKSWR